MKYNDFFGKFQRSSFCLVDNKEQQKDPLTRSSGKDDLKNKRFLLQRYQSASKLELKFDRL